MLWMCDYRLKHGICEVGKCPQARCNRNRLDKNVTFPGIEDGVAGMHGSESRLTPI